MCCELAKNVLKAATAFNMMLKYESFSHLYQKPFVQTLYVKQATRERFQQTMYWSQEKVIYTIKRTVDLESNNLINTTSGAAIVYIGYRAHPRDNPTNSERTKTEGLYYGGMVTSNEQINFTFKGIWPGDRVIRFILKEQSFIFEIV
jgi:hypothetical protein